MQVKDSDIAPSSARARAYRAVREGILDGTFRPGTFIEETQVCDLAQVSRTPVREALNRLAVEGLIDLLPRRGAMVTHVTAQDLHELYEARRLIEGHAVRRLCADRRGAPQEMRRLWAEMQGQAGEDLLRHVDLNRQFHHALVESAGNRVLTRIFAGMHTSVTRVSMSALALDLARREIIQSEHLALVVAIDAHDAEAAIEVLNRHLQPIQQVVARLPG